MFRQKLFFFLNYYRLQIIQVLILYLEEINPTNSAILPQDIMSLDENERVTSRGSLNVHHCDDTNMVWKFFSY